MCRLDFDVDILSVKQPHQKEPKEDKCDRKTERGVDRLKPRKEERLVDPLLQRDLFSIGARHSHHAEQSCHDAGKDEESESVYTKDDERPRPPFHLLDVDQPIAGG